MATAEVCRHHGVSWTTFYKWKAKFGRMDVSDARRLKTLEQENSRLKRLLAEAELNTRKNLLHHLVEMLGLHGDYTTQLPRREALCAHALPRPKSTMAAPRT